MMEIKLFQITASETVPIDLNAKTLDEVTRELPQGFYTTFSTLCQGTKVVGLHAHLRRLNPPTAEHALHPTVNEKILQARIADLVRVNYPKESRIRIILTKNDGRVYIAVQPFDSLSKQVYENGVKVVTTKLSRKYPHIKDTGFISASVSQREQISRDVFEVLLTRKEKILEGMTSNFYGITGKQLVTARFGILPGITRRVVLRIARGQGMVVNYRFPRVDEKFDEAFLTSSSRGVVPIVAIDNKPVGEGMVGKWTKALSKAYLDFVETRSENLLG